MSGPYKTADVSKILRIPPGRLRSYARRGWVDPGRGEDRRYLFSFRDLLVLKATRNLLRQGVPARRISLVLASLRRQLNSGTELTSLQIYSDGKRIVVWDGSARWQPDSGQFLFNFGSRSLGKSAVATKSDGQFSAADWYHLALELDDSSPEEAIRAYEEALEIDSQFADAHVNLGRVLHKQKKFAEAERHYREALRLEPGDGVASFNLGVLCHETGRLAEAATAYADAIALDPKLPDAHYNLALVLEERGERQKAIRHLREFERLTRKRFPGSRERTK
jgi:tetratricopeptide (TPR) repeat protein